MVALKRSGGNGRTYTEVMHAPKTHFKTMEHASAIQMSDKWHEAVDNGHDMEPAVHDTDPHTWIAQCMTCHAWLGVDHAARRPSERPEEVYGAVPDGPCPGAPPAPGPALRRTPEEVGGAPYVPEPKPSGAGIQVWNWLGLEIK